MSTHVVPGSNTPLRVTYDVQTSGIGVKKIPHGTSFDPRFCQGLKVRDAPCCCRANFTEWYRLYARPVRQFVLSCTGDPVVADDCTSETFVRALASRHSFRCRGQGVRPWLVMIARNVVRDYYRSARYRMEISVDSFVSKLDDEVTPEQFVIRRAMVRDLSRGFDQLNAAQVMCLRLRFFDELSVQQTAKMMRRSADAVRALQYRALRRLESILGSQQE